MVRVAVRDDDRRELHMDGSVTGIADELARLVEEARCAAADEAHGGELGLPRSIEDERKGERGLHSETALRIGVPDEARCRKELSLVVARERDVSQIAEA